MDNTPAGNQSSFFGTKVSIPGINVNSAGDNQLILKDNYNQRIYYNANGVATVLLGLRSSVTPNEYGLFVSQDGVDVNQATDEQLIFNSNNDTFEILKKVPISITYSHTSGSEYHQTSVAHGLSFTSAPGFNAYNTVDPGMVAFWGFTPQVGTRPNPTSLVVATGGEVVALCYMEATVDINNVYLMVQTGGGEPAAIYTFSSVIYLLRETFS